MASELRNIHQVYIHLFHSDVKCTKIKSQFAVIFYLIEQHKEPAKIKPQRIVQFLEPATIHNYLD